MQIKSYFNRISEGNKFFQMELSKDALWVKSETMDQIFLCGYWTLQVEQMGYVT